MKRRSFIQGILGVAVSPIAMKTISSERLQKLEEPELKQVTTKSGRVWSQSANFAKVLHPELEESFFKEANVAPKGDSFAQVLRPGVKKWYGIED